jgi:chromosome segregation ATPase
VKNSRYNITRIVNWISAIEDLQSHQKQIQKDINTLNAEENRLKGAIETLQQNLSEKKTILSEIHEYKQLGLDLTNLTMLRDSIIKIGAQHNLPASNAFEKFCSDIKKDYDTKVGFEKQITSLQDTAEKWIQKEKTLKEQYSSYRTTVNSLSELLKKNISPSQIEEWNHIIRNMKEEPYELTSNLKKYVHFKQLKDDRNRMANQAEKKLIKLHSQIKELKEKKIEIEESIRTLTSEGVQKITTVSSQLDKSVANKLALVDDEMNKTSTRIKTTIKEFEDALETLYEKSLTVGKNIGKYEALDPLLKLINEQKGAPHEVHSTILQVNEAYATWLKSTVIPNISITSPLNILIHGIRSELGIA